MQGIFAQNNFPWSVLKLLRWTTSYFHKNDIENPRLEAEIIISHVLDIDRIDLYLRDEFILSEIELYNCLKLIKRKYYREPISYILGNKEFWSLDFRVNNSVLIPRPETECLVNSVIPFLTSNTLLPMKILDMGTGSGAIVISLASEFLSHQFYALDISHEALCIAKENAIKNKLDKNIVFLVSSWTTTLKLGNTSFDLIISNPPYVKSNELHYLKPEVTLYEPIIALDGGPDGLNCFREVIKNSLFYLNHGGLLALEIGSNQAQDVKKIIESYSQYSDIKVITDYSGLDRIIHVRRN